MTSCIPIYLQQPSGHRLQGKREWQVLLSQSSRGQSHRDSRLQMYTQRDILYAKQSPLVSNQRREADSPPTHRPQSPPLPPRNGLPSHGVASKSSSTLLQRQKQKACSMIRRF